MNHTQLAERIATQLMGWKTHDGACHIVGSREYPHLWRDNKGRLFLYDGVTDRHWSEQDREWSITDPAVTFEIMEAMEKRGYMFDMHCHPEHPTLAHFQKIATGKYIVLPPDIDEYARGETRQLAVALAAVSALDGESK